MEKYSKMALEIAGIDIDEASERFKEDFGLFEGFLVRLFNDDNNFTNLTEAVLNNDSNTAFAAAAALKGICAELYISQFEDIMSQLSDFLSEGDMEPASDLMPEITRQYKKLSETVKDVFKCSR